jgi:hypothetical protein
LNWLLAISISDIFEKLGIKGYDDLKEAEKKVYLSWAETLSRKEITLEDLKRILPAELERANRELSNLSADSSQTSANSAFARVSPGGQRFDLGVKGKSLTEQARDRAQPLG